MANGIVYKRRAALACLVEWKSRLKIVYVYKESYLFSKRRVTLFKSPYSTMTEAYLL